MNAFILKWTHGGVILLLSVLSIFVYGQNPDWQWARACGNSSLEMPSASATDQAGNVYICGMFNSPAINFGTGLLINQGAGDLFLVKYSATGTPLWARSIGGSGTEAGQGIAVDPAGNVYVCGVFSSESLSIGTVSLNNYGATDILLACYSPVGNIKWAISAGGQSSDAANALVIDESGDIIVAGDFQSQSMDFGGITLESGGSWDVFLAKVTPAGNVVWAESAGGLAMESALGVETDLNGNVFFTGFFTSGDMIVGNDTLHAKGNNDIILAKYSPAGIPEWAKAVGSFDAEIGYDLMCNETGDVFLTGSMGFQPLIFGSDTLTPEGQGEAFLARFDTHGEAVWARSFGGNGLDYATSLEKDSANTIYVLGNFFSDTLWLGSRYVVNQGISDVFVATFNEQGLPNALFSIGDAGNEVGTGLCMGQGNNVFVSGFFESPSLQIGPDVLINSGDQDIFCASFKGLPAGLAETRSDHLPVIYPIPSDGLFRVNIPDQGNFSFELISLTGSLLHTSEMTTGINAIHCPGLESGIYFYRILSKDGKMFSGKLLVN